MNYELKKAFLLTVLGCLMATHAVGEKKKEVLPYQNAALTIDERVSDLLQRMTLEEKIGQLRCTMAWNYYDPLQPPQKGETFSTQSRLKGKASRGAKKDRREVVPSEQFIKDIQEGQIGMLWATYRADPWTQKSLENGLTPELAAKCGNALQRYVKEHTRLGIPLFLAEEAPHGHMAIGATVFPTGLGMAATWSPTLIEQAGRVISKEIRLQGAHISYGPVLDLARDPRWSRVEETMGEDPVLTGIIGAAQVRGLGGGDLSQPYSTLATLKHFIAYGTTEGGQNGGPTLMGPREMWENFLPPFKQVIDAGALSVMTSYNSMDGQPCTSNGYLLTDVLRKQWQFRGFVVSDLYSIDGLAGTHRVAANRQEAAVMALKAGVDVDLGAACYAKFSPNSTESLPPLEELGPYIDRAVERVLRLKFEMGLFDNPYVDPAVAAREVRSEENKQVALDVARASITLLKNSPLQPPPTGGGSSATPSLQSSSTAAVLPLKKEGVKVLVCGPNADNIYNMLGDYTAPQDDGNVKTVLDGIRQKGVDVEYVKGCAVRDTTQSNIGEAVEAARRCDVIVCCVGGSSARDFKTSYKETGAAITDNSNSTLVPDMDSGEGYDRATLTLLGRQQQLLEALRATGKPLVVVYIEGRPLDKSWAATHADALLTAYYPGQEGGTAIADVLFGDYNPAGRLPVSVPANIGQLPVYYNKKAPRPHDYVEMSAQPLYAFGHGLSYTTFEYANLVISPLDSERSTFSVKVDVTNTGERDGEEVVQLYLHDDLASTVQPVIQLKAFDRVYIKRGETRTVSFTLTADDLAIVDANMQRVVEPGTFTVLVGAASDDIRLRGTLEVPSNHRLKVSPLGAGMLGLKIPHLGTPLLGAWTGKLDVGPMSLTLVLRLEQADGFIKVSLDSPDQGAKGIPAKKEYISDDSLSVAVEMVGATYQARLKDGKLEGTFSQNGFSAPLVLTKGEPEVKRPQCPQPPYPYETEEVVFKNEADGATLAGTLTWPVGYDKKKKPTVVLLVSGSGQQNRDEELFNHKPFLVIADYLARQGIATLRYDDRATGASVGGDVQNATTQDFMRDAAAGLDFLRSHNAFGKIGILGHSEGGSIAFMLGARGKTDFIVSLAGPGVKGDTLLAAQGNRIMSLSGQPANMTVEMYRQQEAVQQVPWLKWFIDYDPSEDIRQTRCPVFALNGDRDCQVLSTLNLPAIDRLLTSSRHRVKEYPGLNHLFQHCTTGLPMEYGQIEETISPEVLQDIVEWVAPSNLPQPGEAAAP